MDESLHHVTIIRTRYGGIYEGGQWAAFPVDHERIPPDVTGSDSECIAWWGQFGAGIGVGSTPNDALAALEQRIQDGQFYRG